MADNFKLLMTQRQSIDQQLEIKVCKLRDLREFRRAELLNAY